MLWEGSRSSSEDREGHIFIYRGSTIMFERQQKESEKMRLQTSWDHAVCLLRRDDGIQILGKPNWSAFIKCSWIFLLQVKQQHFKFSASLHFHFLVLCNWSSFSFPHSLLCSRTNQDWNRLRQLIEERTCLLFWLCRKPQDLFYQFIQVCCLTAPLGGKEIWTNKCL